MKKPGLVVFLMFLVLLGVSVLFLRFSFQPEKSEVVDYQPPFVSHTEVPPERRDIQYMFNYLIRGEIIKYNSVTQTLLVQREKSTIESKSPTEIKIKKDQVIYCWPRTMGENGEIDIKKSLFTMPEGSVIFLKDETTGYLNSIKNLSGKYVFIQTNPSGEIVKIAIVGCDQ